MVAYTFNPRTREVEAEAEAGGSKREANKTDVLL